MLTTPFLIQALGDAAAGQLERLYERMKVMTLLTIMADNPNNSSNHHE